MPEQEQFTVLLEALADGTPVDWAAAEATAKTEDDRAVIHRLSRIGRFAMLKRNSAASGRAAMWSHLQLLEKIGEGAFGEVYRAHDPRLARDVALKLLHEPVSDDGRRASAVIEEGRLLARIRHPNVVTVYGAQSLNGQVGIWTEFIDGQTLHAIVTEHGPLPSEDVTSIALDLCRALAAVHDAGLLHRDVKAQNVMRETGGRIVLMDFGTGRDQDLVPKGDVSGTPIYLAPELFAGGEASVASDIYALGVLTFFLVTGRYPVTGRTLKDVRDAHLAGATAPVRDGRSEVPAGLANAIERALARDPERRFGSAREFEQALLAEQLAVTGLSARAGVTKRRFLTAAVAFAGLVVVGGAWWWSSGRGVADTGATTLSPPAATTSAGSIAPDVPMPAPPVPVVTPPAAKPDAVVPPHVAVGATEIVLPNLTEQVASVSADGRLLAQIAGDGDVAIRDLATGTMTKLGVKDSSDDGFADYPVFSRDSKRVAYQWNSASDPKRRLGVAEVPPLAGTRPQLFDDLALSVFLVHDWSQDGQSVLVTLGESTSKQQLAWISLRDGTVKPIKEYDPAALNIWPLIRVSPDGQQIAYAAIPTIVPHPTFRYIYLLAADGSHDEALITTAQSNRNPIWSPDGTRLFYTSNISSKEDVWSIAIRDGGADGQPETAYADVGTGNALGLTSDGWYFYRTYHPGLSRIFVAPIPDSPKPGGDLLHPTADFIGLRPRWSPDGQSIAFSRQVEVNAVSAFVMRVQSRKEAPVHKLDAPPMPLLWLDQNGLLEQPRRRPAGPLKPRPPTPPHRLDVTTQGIADFGADLEPDIRLSNASALSADGKTLYAGAFGPLNLVDRLVAVDIGTGTAAPVYQLPNELVTARNYPGFGLSLSPDGNELAVAVRAPEANKAMLFRVGIDGRGYQELYGPYWSSSPYEEVVWTKGGIFFGEAAPPSGPWKEMKTWRVMRIAPTGGVPRPVVAMNGYDSAFDVSPDGSQIAVNPAAFARQPFNSEAGERNALKRIYLGPMKGGGG